MKRIFDVKSHYLAAKEFYLKYERLLIPAALVLGFLVDYLTFTNIKIRFAFSILAVYWFLAGLTIAFVHLYDSRRITAKLKYARLFAPLTLQFFFGALLSASLIFYWFSGTFSISWPFILIIVLLMVSNDVLRRYFLKPAVQLPVYFFIGFSLFALLLPFVFNSLSPWLFVLAGVLSAVIFYFYVKILSLKSQPILQKARNIFISAAAVFLAMNFLYFANVIPPVPLALREAGLYHDIKVSEGLYLMQGEQENFLKVLLYGQTLRLRPGGKVYLYSAVFAPTKLKTTIVHHWQHYDSSKEKWVSQSKLPFEIVGGRQEGYKGFSFLSDLQQGKWRVYIENQRGQVLGRVRFRVERTEEEVILLEAVR